MKRRIYSILSAAALLAGCIPNTAFAEGDSVTIKTPSRIFAGAAFTLEISSDDTDFTYQWLSADSEDGEYTALKSDTSDTYIVTPRDKGKYIKAEITNSETNEVTLSDNSVYVENLGPVSRTSFNTENVNATMLTPSENVFSVGGRKFILLEEMNDSKSHYYVMTEEIYGNRVFDSNLYAKFDPTADGNIGKFLNTDFLTAGGGGKILPDEIKEHIDFEHIWWTEAGMSGGDCPSDYSFTAGVGLLSMSEAVKYRSRYGWQPGGEGAVAPWWSRTQRGSSGSEDNILAMMNTNDGGKGNMWDKKCNTIYYIRPTFYLDEDFFREEKCNLSQTGDNIKKMMAEKYTIEDLESLYSIDELISLGFDIKAVVISKETVPNSGGVTALVASMSDDEAAEFKYQWFLSDTEEEEGTEVFANTTDRYIIATNDIGKYISAAVTPVYADGSEGETVSAINKIYVDSIGALQRTDYTSDDRRPKRDNPKEYLLNAGGEELILLDAFDDETDTLYVMTADAKGQHVFDSANNQKFDPEGLTNIGYWLNNDFLTATVTISDTVQKYINKEHVWWIEPGNSRGNSPEEYSVTAGVALLSRSEYSKYWGKFGWDNNGNIKYGWWLRTGRNTGANDVFCGIGITDGNYSSVSANGYGNTWNKTANTSQSVRPTFYLTKDFLLNVKITEMGEKTAEALRKICTPAELMAGNAGYTENDLLKLGFIERPKAKNVAMTGKVSVGAKISGEYLYSGEKTEKNSVCGFEAADSIDGAFSKIADGRSYTIGANNAGKYIRFFVTPVNEDGVSGDTVYSEAVKVVGTVSVAAGDVVITDEAGKAVTSLAGVNKLNVSVKLENYTSSEKLAWIMLFVYDSEGNMLDNRAVSARLGANESAVNKKLSIPLSGYSEGNYARLIIWDGLSSMNPAQNFAVTIN